jgi:uncharacterized protein YoaH (UPF0181 family)
MGSPKKSIAQWRQGVEGATSRRYVAETTRGESSGSQAASGRTRLSKQIEESPESSDEDEDEEDDDEAEEGEDEEEEEEEEDDNDEPVLPTSSRHQRSDSLIESRSAPAMQQQAHAALQRLVAQGYTQAQALAMVQATFRKSTSGQRSARHNANRDNEDSDDNGDAKTSGRGGDEDSQLPVRLPGPFEGDLVWRGQDLREGCEVISLGTSDIEAVLSSIKRYKGDFTIMPIPNVPIDLLLATGRNIGDITKNTFPLPPKLEKRLREASRQIHRGRGFVTIRGLDKARFDDMHREDSTIAFAGIAAHVCPEKAISTFSRQNLAMGWLSIFHPNHRLADFS